MREGNVFVVSVCHSVHRGSPCDHYPNLFKLVHLGTHFPHGDPLVPSQTCSNFLTMLPIHLSASRRLPFDWKAFLLYQCLACFCTWFFNVRMACTDKDKFWLSTVWTMGTMQRDHWESYVSQSITCNFIVESITYLNVSEVILHNSKHSHHGPYQGYYFSALKKSSGF